MLALDSRHSIGHVAWIGSREVNALPLLMVSYVYVSIWGLLT